MYPSRFGTLNSAISSGGAVVQNSAGLHAPGLDMDTRYPMNNFLLNDRKVLWTPGGAAFPRDIKLDVDLGGSSITAISVHGLRLGASQIQSVDFYTQAGAYDGTGTWTLRGSVPYPAVPDVGVFFAAVTVESVRVVFHNASGPFVCGKLFAGDPWYVGPNLIADQGTLESTPQANATIYTLPSGSTFLFNLGDNARIIRLTMSNISDAQRALLQGLAAQVQPFVHIDSSGAFWDCILAGKSVPTKLVSPNPLFTCSLDLLAIP